MDVKLPSGLVIKNVPDGITKDELRQKLIANGVAKPEDFGMPADTSSAVAQIPTEGYPQVPVTETARDRTLLESAIQGAAAVPIMAGAARGIMALTQGGKAAPYAARLGQAVIPQTGKQLVAEGALGAISGVTGEIGARAAPAGYGTLGEVGGGILGGLGGASVASLTRNIADTATSIPGLFSASKDTMSQIADLAGKGAASKQAITALTANPNLGGTIQRAAEIESSTGINLPMLAAANGDTTISSYLQSQIARGENVEFTAALKQQYEAAEKALSSIKGKVAPSMREVDAYVKKKALETEKLNKQAVEQAAAASAKRQTGLQNIDNRIAELSSTLDTGVRPEEIGTRLTNLLSAKEASIRSELSPQYEKIIKSSMDAGIVLPGASAKSLRDFAVDETNDDVFAAFPSLYKQIKSVFRSPSPVEGTKAASKYTFAKEAATPNDIPLNTLDSLKREVNKSIRDTNDKDQLRKLYALRQEVDKAIDGVDPVFSAPYRALDKEYAVRLGIPFNEAGVVQIDRSKFTSDTVSQLTRRPETIKQVFAAAGDTPETRQVITDAFLFDISKNRSIINTATGELNVGQLKRYMSQNKEKIDLVPGLREQLEGLAGNVSKLVENRTRLLQAEKQAGAQKIENLYTQAYGANDGLSGVVRRALSNPSELDSLVNLAGKDQAARGAIKSAMLDDVLSAQGDRLELFNTNKSAFEKVFGKDQTKQLFDIVEASQRLKDNPFAMRININTISKSQWEELTGTKAATTAGEFRNQIMTAPRVFINHLGRFFQKQATDAEAAEVQKFLLDPKALQQASQMVQEINTRGFTERAAGLMGKLMKNSSSSYLFGALTGAGIGAQERQQQQQPQDDLLQGYPQ